LLLKPGMTANVTIVTAHRDIRAANPMDALRFAPAGTPLAQANALDGADSRRHARVGADAWRRDTAGLGHDWPRRRQHVELIDSQLHERRFAWFTDQTPPSRRTAAGYFAALRRRRHH